MDFETEDDEPELSEEEIRVYLKQRKSKIFDPKPYVMKQTKKIIAVVDTETDPFEEGLIVKPFCLGFDTGDRYVDFWGDNCVDQFFDYLSTQKEEYIIYAHNGGKFDFFFFLKYLDTIKDPMIMNGRLVKIYFAGQEFRDSYSIIPQPLSAYKKDEIDYNDLKPNKREKNRLNILKYMKSDCAYTRELITGFHEMFGDKLTIASAALPTLHSLHGFQKIIGSKKDECFRKYFYGGRNQCFETGVLEGNWKLYDRNSMYPAVMRDSLHPISSESNVTNRITKNTDFACIEAINNGALPSRKKDGGLDFTIKQGVFWATIHEINTGLETGTLKINKVRHAWEFTRKATFDEFVNRFYNLRLEAKKVDDKVRDILYKFCLNSGYGKFALNPRAFKQWRMTTGEIPQPQISADCPEGWQLDCQNGEIFIWQRPTQRKTGFYNITTAASITGAARANLLLNLSLSKRPIYCDTDSIICESFNGDLDESKLGGWKLEAEGNRCAIAGKKMYALFNHENVLKKASKGVNISAQEIIDVCNGKEIIYKNPVPKFNLDGTASFIERRINMTG